jgi:hypothetical protein
MTAWYDDDGPEDEWDYLSDEEDRWRDALDWSEFMAETVLGLTWREWFDLDWEREAAK